MCSRAPAGIVSVLQELEDIYETEAVLGTLVVAGDDADAGVIAEILRSRDHSVAVLAADVPKAAAEAGALRAFADGEARALVMSYEAWAALRREVERYAMGHSVLVVGGMDNVASRYVGEWARDAHRRGLVPATVTRGETDYHVLTYPEADSASASAGGDDGDGGDPATDGIWRDF
jgi:hypothetical protein